jgi:hypothetical protein
VPNLREDETFVDEPHLVNRRRYQRFLEAAAGKKVVMLELGVGYNSPGALGYPFEQLIARNDLFRLVRVNLNDLEFILRVHRKTTVVQQEIAGFLKSLL